MNLKELYNKVDTTFSEYESACKDFQDEIYNRFDCSVSIIYQYGDGFVIAFEDNDGEYNSTFDLDVLSKMRDRDDFIRYLKCNTIS